MAGSSSTRVRRPPNGRCDAKWRSRFRSLRRSWRRCDAIRSRRQRDRGRTADSDGRRSHAGPARTADDRRSWRSRYWVLLGPLRLDPDKAVQRPPACGAVHAVRRHHRHPAVVPSGGGRLSACPLLLVLAPGLLDSLPGRVLPVEQARYRPGRTGGGDLRPRPCGLPNRGGHPDLRPDPSGLPRTAAELRVELPHLRPLTCLTARPEAGVPVRCRTDRAGRPIHRAARAAHPATPDAAVPQPSGARAAHPH